MIHKVVTFSGWGQAHDALEIIVPGGYHVPYHQHTSIEALFAALAGTETETLIGWSLGGQIAIRALEQGIIKAKKLVLLATPYQFTIHRQLRVGIPREEFVAFKMALASQPEKVLRQYGLRIAKNDSRAKEIASTLIDSAPASDNWGYWLEELGNFSCQSVDFSGFPDTTIIHGRQDAIVDVSQAGLFIPFLPHCHIDILDKCAHAPHLHEDLGVRI